MIIFLSALWAIGFVASMFYWVENPIDLDPATGMYLSAAWPITMPAVLLFKRSQSRNR